MAEPINLNRYRKQRQRDDDRKKADENAVKFGRTKADKLLDKTRKDQAERRLDGHKRDGDE